MSGANASNERYKDKNYADASQRFLLVMIWKLANEDENMNVEDVVTRDEILGAEPYEFKDLYDRMLEKFKDQKISVNNTEREISKCFCIKGTPEDPIKSTPENPLKISFFGMCVSIANCIWRCSEGNFEYFGMIDQYLEQQISPIQFLRDCILNEVRGNYAFFGETLDGTTCVPGLGSLNVQLTDEAELERIREDTSIKDQLDAINRVERAVQEAEEKETIKKYEKLAEAPNEKPDRPPRLPSSIERVLVDILYFVVLSGGGLLTFAAISGILDITSKFMLPNLNYGLNLGLGIAGGIAALASIAIFSIRILNSREKNQNKLREKMRKANGFERVGLRVVGVYKTHETEATEDQALGDAIDK